jgi:hypothetical protein
MRYSPTATPTRTTSRTSPPSRATARRRRHSAREAQDARHRQRAVEAFVRRKVKEKVINEDGTTEVKATERVNKQHLVQALLMLATAETGTSSVPNKKKFTLRCAGSINLVQIVFEEMMMRDEG